MGTLRKSNMKRILWVVIWALMLFVTGCKKPVKFEINGIITNASGKMIYLEELMVSTTRPVDSAKIGKNGEFRFREHVSIPTFYLLKMSEDNFITLLVDSAEVVTLKADAANYARDYLIEGSPGSLLVKELTQRLNNTKLKLDSIRSLSTLYADRPDLTQLQAQWNRDYEKIVQDQINYSTSFVSEHPFSMASVLALYQKFDDENYVVRDLHALRVAASALNSFYPSSEHVKALYSNTLQLLARERSSKVRQFIQEQGENSPEVVLPTPKGNQVALSSLRGKYVLLHFWSAVDQNSRIVNPVLVEAYQKYKNKGFEIYQVSVDRNRAEWVDAIDKDKLVWTNVGDMEGSTSAVLNYNIQTVPYNYLLDREGMIIAQNLAGPALDKVLASVLK